MKHWFVNWLLDLVEDANFEEDRQRFEKWAEISEDMIKCGLEDLAFKYYDTKQSISPNKLPPRPDRKTNWTLDGVAENLESLIEQTTNEDTLELLNVIYITFSELATSGMKEAAISYYLRKKNEYPELRLNDLLEDK